jgi:hypothetical protein
VKETWYAEKKRSVIEHWEQASFQKQLREIEYALKMQRRRLRLLLRTARLTQHRTVLAVR